jgi:hypothetical protein
MTWAVIIFHMFLAVQKSFVPFKNICVRHTIFTATLSQELKSLHCEFLKFDEKLDLNSLLTL